MQVTETKAILQLATVRQKEIIRHTFSEDEINNMQGTITHNLRKHYALQEELQEIKDDFKAKMKPLERDNKVLLGYTHNGFVDKEMEVYLVPDYDNKIMELYDEAGIKVGERRMLMDELRLDLKHPQ